MEMILFSENVDVISRLKYREIYTGIIIDNKLAGRSSYLLLLLFMVIALVEVIFGCDEFLRNTISLK